MVHAGLQDWHTPPIPYMPTGQIDTHALLYAYMPAALLHTEQVVADAHETQFAMGHVEHRGLS